MPNPLTLTAAQEAEARAAFRDRLRRELLIELGPERDWPKSLVNELILLDRRLKVTPRLGLEPGTSAAEVRFVNAHGGLSKELDALQELLTEAREAEALASFGEDPGKLLVERLQLLGLSADEAAPYRHHVERRLDGRVYVRTRVGEWSALTPSPRNPSGPLAEDERDTVTNPRPAITAAVRAILAERENPRPPERRVDPSVDPRGAI